MTTAELAPPRGAGGLEVIHNPLTSQAAGLLEPRATLYVPERKKLHIVTAEETIAFGESWPLSPMVEEALKDPELVTTIFPMMAKNWWRAEHCVGTAEIFERAYNDRDSNGINVLEKAGFNIPKDRARKIVRAFIGHDLGMAFTRRSNEELNPEELVNLREDKIVWDDMKRHPELSSRKGRHHFDPMELDLMGCHQSLGKVRDIYGRNPYKEVTDAADLADDMEHLLFTKIDIVQAATATGRRYHNERDAAGALALIRAEFRGSDPSLDEYLARLAYERKDFRLVATPEMEEFNDSLRGEDTRGWSGENKKYWYNPHALAGVFSHGLKAA